jgi:hypothetical protein
MGITRMDTTTRTAIIDRIHTMATIIGPTIGTVGIAIITATTVTTVIGAKVTKDLEIQTELARKQFRASFFFRTECFARTARENC